MRIRRKKKNENFLRLKSQNWAIQFHVHVLYISCIIAKYLKTQKITINFESLIFWEKKNLNLCSIQDHFNENYTYNMSNSHIYRSSWTLFEAIKHNAFRMKSHQISGIIKTIWNIRIGDFCLSMYELNCVLCLIWFDMVWYLQIV